MNVNLSPVELTLVAAAVNEKIAWLDAEALRLRMLAEDADAWTAYHEQREINRTMRSHYTAIVRRLEQALDVPFADGDEALRAVLEQGTVVVSR